MSTCHVAGVGVTQFYLPQDPNSVPYTEAARRAATAALADAGIEYDHVEQAFTSYVFGDSASGHRALYEVGLTGIPILNVSNNCSSGSSALFYGRQALLSGEADCVLVCGFEQFPPDFDNQLPSMWSDGRPAPLALVDEWANAASGAPRGNAAFWPFYYAMREYIDRYDADWELFAAVAAKSRRHGVRTPYAARRHAMSVDEIMAGPAPFEDGYRMPMGSFYANGAAAAVLVSDDWLARYPSARTVKMRAQAMATDTLTSTGSDIFETLGAGMTRRAATQVYEAASIGIGDVDVIELHDCFSGNEVFVYEALGMCGAGEAQGIVAQGENTYGGRWVVGPSGGLLSKGHPLGATGVAQCAELVMQLRGEAGDRQVEGARLALQHNLGLGGAVVVTLYERT